MAKKLFSILSVLLALGCCLVFGAEESAIPSNNQRIIGGQVQRELLNQEKEVLNQDQRRLGKGKGKSSKHHRRRLGKGKGKSKHRRL